MLAILDDLIQMTEFAVHIFSMILVEIFMNNLSYKDANLSI